MGANRRKGVHALSPCASPSAANESARPTGGSMPALSACMRAESVADAVSMLGDGGDSVVLAGGHSLVPMLKLRVASPSRLVDISGIAELVGIRDAGSHLAVGAMTTHRDVAESTMIQSGCPVLAETAAGLPKRVPQANLVPGSPLREERPLRIVRDAASIAAHTTGYFRGWRRGQAIGGFAMGGRPGRESPGLEQNDPSPSGRSCGGFARPGR